MQQYKSADPLPTLGMGTISTRLLGELQLGKGPWPFGGFVYTAGFPLWIPTTIFGLYPAWALVAFVRRRRRLARGNLCKDCGYNLTGNVSGVCPECGTEVNS